ncbi:MAG: serine hydrolase [Chloroflexia bacterium]
MTVEALAKANGLTENALIDVGQRLTVPSASGDTGMPLPGIQPRPAAPQTDSLAKLAPALAAYLEGREGVSSAAVYLPEDDTIYTFNAGAKFEMASTVKVPIMITHLSQRFDSDPRASAPGSDLLAPMITVSDNDAATALLERVGGARAVQAELDSRGLDDTTINPEYWGLSTTTAPDMALLLRSLYVGQGLNAPLRVIAFGLMSGVVAEQRWGAPAGLPPAYSIAFKGGWLPVNDGWLVHQVGVIEGNNRTAVFAFYNKGQPSFEYGQETLRRAAELLERQGLRR